MTEKAEGDSEEGSGEEEDSDSDEDDKYSDLQESDDEPEVQPPTKKSKAQKNKKNASSKADDKAMPASDLPFTFKLPESYRDLQSYQFLMTNITCWSGTKSLSNFDKTVSSSKPLHVLIFI